MRALVLSGGGSKGAFQVGALEHILGELQVKYDIIAGISVGALNGSFVSMFPTGQEQEAIKGLVDVWNTVNDDRIFKKNFPFLGETFSLALSFIGAPSLYDSDPLEELVYSTLDVEKVASSGKKLAIGAVSVDNGEPRYWHDGSPDIAKAVAASASYPVFFRPVKIEDERWTDGGIRNIIPIQKAIEMGATEVDVISCGPLEEDFNFDSRNSLRTLLTVISVTLDEILETDFLIGALLAEQDGITVRLLAPDTPLSNSALDFSPDKIKLNREIGYNAAKSIDWEYNV